MEYRSIISNLSNPKLKGKLQDYYTKNVPPKFGEGSASILATDLANQYIVLLVGEIYKKTLIKNMVSEGISTDGTPENLEKQAELLVNAYSTAIEDEDIKGVYTVWTAGDSKSSVGHQNWLYFDFEQRKIIRLEPNGVDQDQNFPGFKMGQFMDLLAHLCSKSMGKQITWELALDEININNFDGCRATSTILATMHILGIDFEEIRNIDNTDRHPNSIKALVYILQKNIDSCKLKVTSIRKTRKTSGKLNLISPT